MERVFSDEEKLRRAIEISQRRNNSYNNTYSTRVNVNDKKDYKLFRKMILQIIICLLIYIIFHLITTTNYAFSDDVIKNTNNILNYDINFEKMYKDCQNFFITAFNKEEKENNIINNTTLNNETNMLVENTILNNKTGNVIQNIASINEIANNVEENEKENDDNETLEENEKDNKEEKIEKTQMEKDAEKVLELCQFKKPLSGKITSEFGAREATIKGMTTDHKGLDISANSGTNIKSAIDGTVSVAEENSEYGKFIKITNGDVMTVYAHCKTLKVKVGDKIKAGQTIALVGSTGNSTGPHLHFEIRYENRYINPRYVIDF